MVRIAVVEDDVGYRSSMVQMLKRYQKEKSGKTLLSWDCFENGMQIAGEYKPVYDIIFMDIEMPVLDGMAAAREIRKADHDVIIIFITNLAQYAIQGYEVNAFDYVLKPVGYYAFSMKLDKALQALQGRSDSYVLLEAESGTQRIAQRDIYYAEIQAHYIHFFTEEGEFTLRGTLKDAAALLDPASFALCNRCYLVNLRHVTGIRDGNAIVHGYSLQISRPKSREFLNRLTDYIGVHRL